MDEAVPHLGELDPHLPSNTTWRGARPTSVLSGIVPSSRLATTDMGRNLEGCAPLFVAGERAGSQLTQTLWLGPRPTSVPYDILIHSVLWPKIGGHAPFWGGAGSPSNTM